MNDDRLRLEDLYDELDGVVDRFGRGRPASSGPLDGWRFGARVAPALFREARREDGSWDVVAVAMNACHRASRHDTLRAGGADMPPGPVELSVALFEQGFTCSQAVLAAYSARYGLDEATALRVSCAYGGGVARSGETCGAVNGALMVIGLAHGKAARDDDAAKERTYALTREFWNRFRARQGSLVCKELIGFDIGTPEGARAAAESRVFRERCPLLVRCAAEIVGELLG